MIIGLIIMGISLLLGGIMAREAINTPEAHLSRKQAFGSVVVLAIFLYTIGFGSTWITVWSVP